MILQTLYQQGIKHKVNFLDEFHVLDLLFSDDGRACGVVALEIKDRRDSHDPCQGGAVATGGFGRIFSVTSNAMAGTGDGFAIPFRRGVPLMDMEFYQFHPTGITSSASSLEAARGEGGILRNGLGEAFAERYAPTLKDLAPRDMVSRFIYQEIKEGRGVDGKDYVYLDLSHLPPDVIDKKLPDITDFARTYLGIEPKARPDADSTDRALRDGRYSHRPRRPGACADADGNTIPGLYSAGENACVSVHGANRLGTNSLVDLVVFGRRAGRHMLEFGRDSDLPPLPVDPEFVAQAQVSDLLSRPKGERIADLRHELQAMMMDQASVVRSAESLTQAKQGIARIRSRYAYAGIDDPRANVQYRSHRSAGAGSMLDCAEALVEGALAREESRGPTTAPTFQSAMTQTGSSTPCCARHQGAWN